MRFGGNKEPDFDDVPYHLPVSAIRATGTATYTTDSVLGRTDPPDCDATVELTVIAERILQSLHVDVGALEDAHIAFDLSDDGRFVSATGEATGEGAAVLHAVVSVAGFVAGVALGGARSAVGVTKLTDDAADAKALEEAIAAVDAAADEAAIDEAFRKAAGDDVWSMRKKLERDVATLLERLHETLAGEGSDLTTRLYVLRQALATARAELSLLDTIYDAWRATTITKRVETYEFLLDVDTIRSAKPNVTDTGAVTFSGTDTAAVAKARDLWETLRVVAVLEDEPVSGGGVPEHHENDQILVRIPRRARLSVYKAASETEPKAELVQAQPVLIVDSLSAHHTITFNRAALRKRTKALKYSAIGGLSGIDETTTSAVAALAAAAEAAPGAVTGGLQQAKALYDAVGALRTRALDQRLAEVEKQVKLKQQQITEAGLNVDATSAAELEQLIQQAAMLKQQKAIADYGSIDVAAETELLKQQLDLINARKSLAAASPP